MARIIVPSLNTLPQMGEILKANKVMKDGKAPGVCGIPTKVYRFDGSKLIKHLHDVIVQIWSDEVIPQDWEDANIVSIFKKGNRKQCGK